MIITFLNFFFLLHGCLNYDSILDLQGADTDPLLGSVYVVDSQLHTTEASFSPQKLAFQYLLDGVRSTG